MSSLAAATQEVVSRVVLPLPTPTGIDRPNYSRAAKMAERIAQAYTHRLLTFCPESFVQQSQNLARDLNYEVDQKGANQKFAQIKELFENAFFPREPGETSERYWQRIAPVWQTTLDNVFSPNPFTFDSAPPEAVDRREAFTEILFSGEMLRLATGGDFTHWDGQWLNAVLNTAWLQIGNTNPGNPATNSAWRWYKETVVDPVYRWPDRSAENARKLITDTAITVAALCVIAAIDLLTTNIPTSKEYLTLLAIKNLANLISLGATLVYAARWHSFLKKTAR